MRVRRDPLGVTLIIGAWNEPYMLTLGAARRRDRGGQHRGDEAVGDRRGVSRRSIARWCRSTSTRRRSRSSRAAFPETTALLAQKWDLIFFTGSPPVGKIVHQAAAKNLTPAVLELGGKNPTIVHSSADIKTAARRIAYGRYMNSGHICTAPDHVLVWPEVKDELVDAAEEGDPRVLRRRPEAEPRLRPGDQPQELRPARHVHGQRHHRRRRRDRPR